MIKLADPLRLISAPSAWWWRKRRFTLLHASLWERHLMVPAPYVKQQSLTPQTMLGFCLRNRIQLQLREEEASLDRSEYTGLSLPWASESGDVQPPCPPWHLPHYRRLSSFTCAEGVKIHHAVLSQCYSVIDSAPDEKMSRREHLSKRRTSGQLYFIR